MLCPGLLDETFSKGFKGIRVIEAATRNRQLEQGMAESEEG
jgi:hypothetical protein